MVQVCRAMRGPMQRCRHVIGCKSSSRVPSSHVSQLARAARGASSRSPGLGPGPVQRKRAAFLSAHSSYKGTSTDPVVSGVGVTFKSGLKGVLAWGPKGLPQLEITGVSTKWTPIPELSNKEVGTGQNIIWAEVGEDGTASYSPARQTEWRRTERAKLSRRTARNTNKKKTDEAVAYALAAKEDSGGSDHSEDLECAGSLCPNYPSWRCTECYSAYCKDHHVKCCSIGLKRIKKNKKRTRKMKKRVKKKKKKKKKKSKNRSRSTSPARPATAASSSRSNGDASSRSQLRAPPGGQFRPIDLTADPSSRPGVALGASLPPLPPLIDMRDKAPAKVVQEDTQGITWNPQRRQWRADVFSHHLGYFPTFTQALAAQQKYRIDLDGGGSASQIGPPVHGHSSSAALGSSGGGGSGGSSSSASGYSRMGPSAGLLRPGAAASETREMFLERASSEKRPREPVWPIEGSRERELATLQLAARPEQVLMTLGFHVSVPAPDSRHGGMGAGGGSSFCVTRSQLAGALNRLRETVVSGSSAAGSHQGGASSAPVEPITEFSDIRVELLKGEHEENGPAAGGPDSSSRAGGKGDAAVAGEDGAVIDRVKRKRTKDQGGPPLKRRRRSPVLSTRWFGDAKTPLEIRVEASALCSPPSFAHRFATLLREEALQLPGGDAAITSVWLACNLKPTAISDWITRTGSRPQRREGSSAAESAPARLAAAGGTAEQDQAAAAGSSGGGQGVGGSSATASSSSSLSDIAQIGERPQAAKSLVFDRKLEKSACCELPNKPSGSRVPSPTPQAEKTGVVARPPTRISRLDGAAEEQPVVGPEMESDLPVTA